MLCRVFPYQNSSILKSILDAANGDIVEAIQKVRRKNYRRKLVLSHNILFKLEKHKATKRTRYYMVKKAFSCNILMQICKDAETRGGHIPPII